MNDLLMRAPQSSEVPRVRHLLRNFSYPSDSEFLAAVKAVPVERFVGALASWVEADFVRFVFACQPGVAHDDIARRLIEAAAVKYRVADMGKLLYGELLADDDPRVAFLKANGFDVLRTERFFRIEGLVAAKRVGKMMERYEEDIPPTWQTKSIRQFPAQIILDLVARYKLMTQSELFRYWGSAATSGFEPDMSSILFDGDQPIGTLLIRRQGEVLFYDVRVVIHPNARLRGLGNLCLLYHNLKVYDPSQPVKWLQFRGGEHEHRETANLALRMGGSELPPRRVYVRLI